MITQNCVINNNKKSSYSLGCHAQPTTSTTHVTKEEHHEFG